MQFQERERWDNSIWFAGEAAHFYYLALRPLKMHPKMLRANMYFQSKNLPKQALKWRRFTGASLETLQAGNLRFVPGERGDLAELMKWMDLYTDKTLPDMSLPVLAIGWSRDGI